MSRKFGFKLTKEHKKSISAGMKRAWQKSVGGTGAASLDGSKEVKSFYGGNKTMQRYIFMGRLPKENYQILCANCNWIKRYENKEFTQPK